MQIVAGVAFSILSLITSISASVSPLSSGLSPRAQALGPAPPASTYLFSVTLNIGNATKPIPIPGGVRIVEPLRSGVILGPALNATITGGLAYPPVLYNQTLQVPNINIYGTTNDGYPFFVTELGVGSPQEQITRLQIDIGGPYLNLSKSFIIGDVRASADRTVVNVTVFKIG